MIAYLIARWFISAFTLLLVALIVPGMEIAGFGSALILAVFLGLVNAILRPIFILITLPLNILTLGLFTFVINGFLLWLLSTAVKGFELSSLGTAIIAALILSIVSWFASKLLGRA